MTDKLKSEVRRIASSVYSPDSKEGRTLPEIEKIIREAILSLIAREVEEKDKRLDELYKEVSYFRDRRCIQLEQETEGIRIERDEYKELWEDLKNSNPLEDFVWKNLHNNPNITQAGMNNILESVRKFLGGAK